MPAEVEKHVLLRKAVKVGIGLQSLFPQELFSFSKFLMNYELLSKI